MSKKRRTMANMPLQQNKKAVNDSNSNIEQDSVIEIDNDSNGDKESIEDILNKKEMREVTSYRGYYIYDDLLAVIDRYTGKKRGDKSDLVNYILRKYFKENGYM